jgi:hypothetical protein
MHCSSFPGHHTPSRPRRVGGRIRDGVESVFIFGLDARQALSVQSPAYKGPRRWQSLDNQPIDSGREAGGVDSKQNRMFHRSLQSPLIFFLSSKNKEFGLGVRNPMECRLFNS